MATLKPFIRISILSFILSILLIYLGIKYHWGDFLHSKTVDSLELEIPEKLADNINTENVNSSLVSEAANAQDIFNPKILKTSPSSTVLASMNKAQITEQCTKLSSKQGLAASLLELSIVNCVVSNYEETFQNFSNNVAANQRYLQKKHLYSQQCQQQLNSASQYSLLEKQLLVGICVSDRLNDD